MKRIRGLIGAMQLHERAALKNTIALLFSATQTFILSSAVLASLVVLKFLAALAYFMRGYIKTIDISNANLVKTYRRAGNFPMPIWSRGTTELATANRADLKLRTTELASSNDELTGSIADLKQRTNELAASNNDLTHFK